MEFVLENQCNTLGSILRENLEKQCPNEFATCVVPEVTSTFLLVTCPDLSSLRKALLLCKEELKEFEKNVAKNKKKKTKK